jgi:hypothetical protein
MTMEHMPAPVLLDGAMRVDSLHMDEHLLSRQDGLSGLDAELLNVDEQNEQKHPVPCNS